MTNEMGTDLILGVPWEGRKGVFHPGALELFHVILRTTWFCGTSCIIMWLGGTSVGSSAVFLAKQVIMKSRLLVSCHFANLLRL